MSSDEIKLTSSVINDFLDALGVPPGGEGGGFRVKREDLAGALTLLLDKINDDYVIAERCPDRIAPSLRCDRTATPAHRQHGARTLNSGGRWVTWEDAPLSSLNDVMRAPRLFPNDYVSAPRASNASTPPEYAS